MDKTKHIRIGDKLIEVNRIENGVPVIEAQTEKIKHADGRIDIVVRVPCLQLAGAKQ